MNRKKELSLELPELEDLEAILASNLAPVRPRTDFVQDLGGRLHHEAAPDPVLWWEYLVLLGLTFVIGLFLVLLGWRITLSILDSLGLRRILLGRSRRRYASIS